jgi:hypothetical protein
MLDAEHLAEVAEVLGRGRAFGELAVVPLAYEIYGVKRHLCGLYGYAHHIGDG